MSERLMSNEAATPDDLGLNPDVFLNPEQIGEGETGGSREELLRAYGEADEEIGVESIDELKALLRATGIPDAEIERRLSGIAE